jgi:ATP-dependent RNA helicase DDX41
LRFIALLKYVKYEWQSVEEKYYNKILLVLQRYRREADSSDSASSDDNFQPYVPLKERMRERLTKMGRLNLLKEEERKGKSSSECEHDNEDEDDGQVWGRKSNISLLDQHTELKKMAEGKPRN